MATSSSSPSKPKSVEALEVTNDSLLILKGPRVPAAPPSITSVPRSSALMRAQQFLPQLKAAQDDLQRRLDEGQDVDVEAKEGDAQYVEMRLGVMEESEDSEPDSDASEERPRDGFTSDTDSDSTISTSTGSDSDNENSKGSNKRKRGHKSKKKLIQVINDK